tara:strand:+ start:309 stop:542 length:234 start_codon:yes stop_codon:yes gene_type:complete
MKIFLNKKINRIEALISNTRSLCAKFSKKVISKKLDKIENNLSVSVSEITNIGIELILKVSTKVEIKSIKNKKKICF